jgi:hypothetical protein
MGLTPEDITALFTTIQDVVQTDASLSATSLRTMLSRLPTPKVVEHLKHYGIEVFNPRTNIMRPTMDVLSEVAEKYNAMPVGSRARIDILGSMNDVRIRNYMDALISNFGEVIRLKNELNKGGGFLDKSSEVALGTVTTQMERLKQAWVDIVATVGQSTKFREIIKSFADWAVNTENVIKQMEHLLPLVLTLMGGMLGKRMGLFPLTLGKGALLGSIGAAGYAATQGGILGETASGSLTGGLAAHIILGNPWITALSAATAGLYSFGKALQDAEQHLREQPYMEATKEEQRYLKMGELQKAKRAFIERMELVPGIVAAPTPIAQSATYGEFAGEMLANNAVVQLWGDVRKWLGLSKEGGLTPDQQKAKRHAQRMRELRDELGGQTANMPLYMEEWIKQYGAGSEEHFFTKSQMGKAINRYAQVLGVSPYKWWIEAVQSQQQKTKAAEEQAEANTLAERLKNLQQIYQARNEGVGYFAHYQTTTGQIAELQQRHTGVPYIGASDQEAIQRARTIAGLGPGGDPTQQLKTQYAHWMELFEMQGKNKEIEKEQLEQLRRAFSELTNTTTRLASSQRELDAVNHELQQHLSWAEKEYVKPFDWQRTRSKEWAETAMKQRSLEIVPTYARESVVDYFHQMGATMFQGRRVSQQYEEMVAKMSPEVAGGIDKRKAVEDKQAEILRNAADINKFLADQNQALARSLSEMHEDSGRLAMALNGASPAMDNLARVLADKFPAKVEYGGRVIFQIVGNAPESVKKNIASRFPARAVDDLPPQMILQNEEEGVG